jgi:hypothetical protein
VASRHLRSAPLNIRNTLKARRNPLVGYLSPDSWKLYALQIRTIRFYQIFWNFVKPLRHYIMCFFFFREATKLKFEGRVQCWAIRILQSAASIPQSVSNSVNKEDPSNMLNAHNILLECVCTKKQRLWGSKYVPISQRLEPMQILSRANPEPKYWFSPRYIGLFCCTYMPIQSLADRHHGAYSMGATDTCSVWTFFGPCQSEFIATIACPSSTRCAKKIYIGSPAHTLLLW